MEDLMILVEEECDDIVCVNTHNEYKGSKAGKFFNRYQYNGVVFTVDEDNAFCNAQSKGTLQQVKLQKGTRDVEIEDKETGKTEIIKRPTFQFLSCRTSEQVINRKKAKAIITAWDRKLQSVEINDDVLAELEAVAG